MATCSNEVLKDGSRVRNVISGWLRQQRMRYVIANS